MMLRWMKYILLLMALLLGSGTLLQMGYRWFQSDEAYSRHPRDTYDPALGRLNSLKKLESYVDSLAGEKGLTPDSIPDYINLADSVVRMRFYYGLQNYRFSENYLTNLAGKYLWSHIGAKVDPDHILNGQKAYCSPSSIVFQELLRRKGFDFRTVKLEVHFCTEVLIDGSWGFYDVSYKPFFGRNPRLSTEELLANPQYLEDAYLYSFRDDFSRNLHLYFDREKIDYGKVNAFAAPRMIWFHRITWFFSWFGWLVFVSLWALLEYRIFGKRKQRAFS